MSKLQPSTKPDQLHTAWDASENNVIETKNALGGVTDYGYDTSGNLLWEQGPQVNTSFEGSGRPVTRFTYDSNNNLTSSCDAQFIWNNGSECQPGAAGVTTYTWDTSDSAEPYGRLTSVIAPGGQFTTTISYDPQNGVDTGLPTLVKGTAIQQPNDQTTPMRAPSISVAYDQYGNVTSYDAGNGPSHFQYDQQNRLLVASDPDNGSTAGSASGAALSTSSYACYYPNGQVAYTETAAQHAADGFAAGTSSCVQPVSGSSALPAAVAYVYDADGNVVYETHHFGCSTTASCTPGKTTRWYDSLDRLVEEALPQDPTDIFTHWLTRYDYDLSDSSSSGVYGGLAAVQRFLPPGASYVGQTSPSGYQWVTTQSWTYDGLDRALTKSYYSPGATMMSTDTWTYDTAGSGLVASFSNAMGDSVNYAYDLYGHVTQRAFSDNNTANLYSGPLASEDMTYDADGRLHSYNNQETGAAFYNYNWDGTLQSYTEPNAVVTQTRPTALGTVGPITTLAGSPEKYNYTYYADGMLQQVATTDNAWSQTFGYRADGRLDAQQSSGTWTQSGQKVTGKYSWQQQFSAAGRLLSKSDAVVDPCIAGQCHTLQSQCAGGCAVGQSLNIKYDAYGRNGSWSIPSGTYSNFTYDLENEPTGFSTTSSDGASTTAWDLSYSARGELLAENESGADAPLVDARSADGFLYSTVPSGTDANGDPTYTTYTFDPRSSTALGWRSQTLPFHPGTFSYDLAGRRTGARQYDALNRILKATNAYAYGPGTIPFEIGGLTQHAPLGEAPAFTTDGSGNVVDMKFGMNANVMPTDASNSGFTIYDRDPFGFVAAQRNPTGTSAWTVPNLFGVCEGATVTTASTGFAGNAFNNCASNGELYPYRTDGYYDGSLTFRGVRTYDADTQQWSTADTFGGNPSSPVSTLAYNYAGNNPAMFGDPSGFCDTGWDGYIPTFEPPLDGYCGDLTIVDYSSVLPRYPGGVAPAGAGDGYGRAALRCNGGVLQGYTCEDTTGHLVRPVVNASINCFLGGAADGSGLNNLHSFLNDLVGVGVGGLQKAGETSVVLTPEGEILADAPTAIEMAKAGFGGGLTVAVIQGLYGGVEAAAGGCGETGLKPAGP